MSEQEKKELRDKLLELSEACPLHKSNPKDCPLFALRKMEPMQRLKWFDVLTDDELSYLAGYHQICAATKLKPR